MLAIALALLCQEEMAEADFAAETLRPFAETHCFLCHAGEEPDGDLDLAALLSEVDLGRDRGRWLAVRSKLARGEMPPPTEPRPPAEELAAVVGWLTEELGLAVADPGRVTLRRLNRTEYENTVVDLLGVDFDASEVFPADGVGHGFDNIGDVLALPPFLLEKYLSAAERIARAAVVTEESAEPPVRLFPAAELRAPENFKVSGGLLRFYTNAEASVDVEVPREGTYLLRARVTANQAGPELAKVELKADGRRVARYDVGVEAPEVGEIEVEVRLAEGPRTLSCGFINDFYEPENPDPKRRDRNLSIESLALVGPTDALPFTPFQEALFRAAPEPEDALRVLARRMWRRPPTEREIERLRRLAPRDAAREVVVQRALVAMLVSPSFLFLVEQDLAALVEQDLAAPVGEDLEAPAVRALDPFELAARLSYFLWSSAPDAELSEAADSGALLRPDVLAAEVGRMLADARSRALAVGFAEQWLEVRRLADAQPDPTRFPGFDEDLRRAMLAETRLFFESVLREGRDVWELLGSDYTFVNERLARHYGVPGVRGPEMRRVRLPSHLVGRRGGVLTHASVLTATSNPTRTSPVLRGKWILDTLLAAPPPDPPPGVGDLDDSRRAARAASLRERLELHRSDPACATCHATMDALGFGLENFDAIGAWRETDGPHAIDASGELPDGRRFDGPAELVEVLAEDGRFLRALYENLLVYALGRGLAPADGPAVERALLSLGPAPTLADMIRSVVRQEAFQKRRVAGGR